VTLRPGGEPVEGFESDKVRALLAYLGVEGTRPHRREKLAGLLWPRLPESSARANLRVALANLRKLVGDRPAKGQAPNPPLLQVTRQTIQFHPESDLWVDVAEFLHLLQFDGRPQQIVRRLEKAMALYRGAFLDGFSLADSPAFEEWAVLERERLLRQALVALDRLAGWYKQRGDFDRALHYARRRTQLEPWQEQGQRQLMRLLALDGQRNAALAQYETLRHLLAEELTVEPADETVALYRQIRDGQARYDLGEATPSHNLPAPLTPFVGREEALDQLYHRLRDPGCRLVTLVGPGGSGKTRLALEVAREIVAAAPWGGSGPGPACAHGVFFLSLAPLSSAGAIVPTLAEALSLTPDEAHDPRQQLLDYLRHKEMLLILDNLEHLDSAAGLVIDLLRAAPRIKILATSRARLNLRAEYLLPVGGMDLPPPGSLPTHGLPEYLRRYSSVQLFLDAAGRVQPRFDLEDDNAADVLQICRLVGGLPLGILLAAASLATLAPGHIAAGIEKGLDFLAAGWQDAPDRQRSMRAVFDHSWRLLSRREQQVLRALSVFRGSISARAAGEVAGTDRGELAGLVHKSLLDRVAEDHFEMHELLRQYAAEKLADSPPAEQAAREAHSACFAGALAQWAIELKGEGGQAALAAMERDAENARAAWQWAARQRHVVRLDRALEGLCTFYELRIRYQQGEATCRLALEQIATIQPQSPEALYLQGRLLAWLSIFVRRSQGTDLARQLLERSLALLDDPRLAGRDTRPARAFALWRWGRLIDSFDRQAAKLLYQQALDLYRALGDRWGEANALATLGSIAWNLGNFDEAHHWHQESLALRQRLGDRRGIANSLMAVGTTALSQGRLAESEEMVRQGCAMRQEIGDRRGMADGTRHLGVACISLGRFAEAASLLEECVAIYDNLGFRFGLEMAMLGEAHLHLGHYQAGRAHAHQGLSIARGTGFRRGIGYGLFVLGAVALAQDRYGQAGRLLQESIAAYREIGQGDELCRSMAGLAYAAWGQKQFDAAWDQVREALASGSELRVSFPLWFCLPAAALLLTRAGQVERAVALYALATRAPAIASSCWFRDVAGHRIEAAAAGLPAGVVAAAQARGQKQELSEAVAELLA
jgi:predicted ATPase/DNA-binding SARP family transcriptional activator